MAKNTLLAAGLEAAAGRRPAERIHDRSETLAADGDLVMVGVHLPRDVRRALKLLEAETGKRLKPLMCEAINDLCAKYGKPQPCTFEG